MKKTGTYKLWLFILMGGASILFLQSLPAAASENWQDMPPIVLNNCIDVDKVLAPNPLSAEAGDFWMVLKYEEANQETGETRSMNQDQSLNMYLVTGLALTENESVGLPTYQFLIVNVTHDNGSSKTVTQWLLSDTNNDGKLDHAKFERVVTDHSGKTINSDKRDIPADQIKNLQAFYDKATRALNSKAEEEPASQCLAS